ncbi:PREDICTED: putative glycerol kinase 5 [Ceratosolen solmsi marchali]|uniref:Glycerol kinase 5 n=1 Tax=Ceratosolen solmsi marchali TaxID=326594 RepID=A0AAJ7DZY5_9HYME|nr:PREDICTED: putative glycerol kinase 5 [Ceratosolen solmsi marchali]
MRYLAALDVGTTTIRCHIVDDRGCSVATSFEKMKLLYPKIGHIEIDPDWLWEAIIRVIKKCFSESEIEPSKVEALGISTQRCSVITWDLESGKHYHNFITWKDLRADSMVKEWNSSFAMHCLRLGSRLLYTIFRNKRYQAGSVLRLMNTQMTLRLLWALENVKGLRDAAISGKAVFGGVDCWLLYKLTGQHVSDVSSASASGLFDPFTMQWAGWAQMLFKLPATMFPRVVDTAGDFGSIPASLFGVEIPITCSMADQAASLFGSGCFEPGDMKLTMGTGSFINVNTGKEPHAMITVLYPLIGWRYGNELAYVVEGSSNDTGTVIEWTKSLELIENPLDTYTLATSVNDSDGVYFIPAFSGLQAPISNHNAAAGFLGIKPTTQKAHLVRSMLESLVFRILLLYECIQRETKFSYRSIRVDGGVSQNDFAMQLLADLTGLNVERSTSIEMSVLGVAYCAGLQKGIWKSKEEIMKLRKVEKIFCPNKERQSAYKTTIENWKKAVTRFKDWY